MKRDEITRLFQIDNMNESDREQNFADAIDVILYIEG